jgi:hypothetical protein
MNCKKIFGLMAVLVMFVIGGLWAQDLKFDGYLNSGLGVVTNDSEGDDPYFKAFGVDSESNGYRFRLNGTYQNEAKNAGVKVRLQGQRRLDQAGYLSMPYLYGWVGFLENKITLTGGLVDDSTWQSADWWWNDDTGEGLGLLLKMEPVKGLNLGFGAYTISQQSGGGNNWLQYTPINSDGTAGTNRLPNFGDIVIKPEDVKYTFIAAYTMPDTFRLSTIFRTKNRAGWTATRDLDAEDYLYGGREESMFSQTELRILAVKDLTAVIVGTFDKIEYFDSTGNIMFSETFGYKMNDLGLGLNAVQFLYNRVDGNDDKVDMNPGLLFNPWVSYTIGNIVPRLDLVYFMGGQSKMANPNQQWERRGFVNLAKAKDAEDDYSVFSIRPSVKFNLDNKTFLEIGDMMNFDSATKDGAYKDEGDDKKNSLFTNVFYVDVKFSF